MHIKLALPQAAQLSLCIFYLFGYSVSTAPPQETCLRTRHWCKDRKRKKPDAKPNQTRMIWTQCRCSTACATTTVLTINWSKDLYPIQEFYWEHLSLIFFRWMRLTRRTKGLSDIWPTCARCVPSATARPLAQWERGRRETLTTARDRSPAGTTTTTTTVTTTDLMTGC